MDATIQKLLEQVIDSPCKLHLLLIFAENPRLDATPRQIADRACRDIWSVTQALLELAEDGVLCVTGDDVHYHYLPRPERLDALRRLISSYDDPIERDRIQSSLRDLASFATFNRQSAWQHQSIAR
ncbi:MAG: hypothetical protein H7Y32_08145 [Chloroflexales bacterium]|nr:hypothetical protein [Chloroflexales bacterium]